MKILFSILKYLAFLVFSAILAIFLCYVFRDFLARKYADFFYIEAIPESFNKDSFNNFSAKFAQDLAIPTRESMRQMRPLPNSAIVVLGGHIETRLFCAISLYFYGLSDLVLITSPKNHIYRDFGGAIQSEIAQMEGALRFMRVNFARVPSLREFGAQSTRDEALDLASYLAQNPLDSLILVTDEFHSARTFAIFSDIFAQNHIATKIYLIPTQNRFFNRDNWHKTELGLISYVLEMPKMLLYYISDSEIYGVERH